MPARKIRVVYKKLTKDFGYAILKPKPHVQIDNRLKGKKHLEILIHESLHILYPERDEAYIQEEAIILSNTLWNEHYRRIDNTNKIPLQDGTY